MFSNRQCMISMCRLATYTARHRTLQQHNQELRDFVATVLAAAALPTPSKQKAHANRNPSNSFANTEAHAKIKFPRPKGMDHVIQVYSCNVVFVVINHESMIFQRTERLQRPNFNFWYDSLNWNQAYLLVIPGKCERKTYRRWTWSYHGPALQSDLEIRTCAASCDWVSRFALVYAYVCGNVFALHVSLP